MKSQMLPVLSLSVLRPGAPEVLVWFKNGCAEAWGIKVSLFLNGEDLKVKIEGEGEAVVSLWMKPEGKEFFPLLPGFMVGKNRPDDTGPYYPQLTSVQDLNHPNLRSPFWGIRADRATVPAAFLFEKGLCRALSVPPYIENKGREHTVNGLRVSLERGVGISIGFVVEPLQFVHEGLSAPGYRGYHNFKGKTAITCGYFKEASTNRRGHAGIIRKLYAKNHEEAPSVGGMKSSVRLVAEALVQDILTPAKTTMRKTVKGEFFKIKDHKPLSILTEIGWTGGAMLAYPFLAMQKRYKKNELAEYAVRRLDRICDCVNSASGFFWDCREGDKGHSRGWWTEGGLSPVSHYAYTQGHACYYLLRSASLRPDRAALWINAAKQVLEKVIKFQQPDGQFPVSFSIKNGKPERISGFAGCWFAAALVELYGVTKEKKYLTSALKALRSYHADIIDLQPCATPMDTHNATDQEGNLALLHALAKLHKITGSKEILAMLKDSADFEMLWRYYYNTRPPVAPLDKTKWGSSGGSVTSAHNPHIHMMHLNALEPVLHLFDETKDRYYLERTRDAILYGCNCICRPSRDFGWGKPGWLCERFCPSDGLIIQHNLKTDTPSSVGCDYHPWNAGVLLEGFTGEAWNRFPELL